MNRNQSLSRAAVVLAISGLIALLALFAWNRWSRDDSSATVELCGYGSIKPIRETDDYPPEVVQAADRALTSVADDLSAQSQPTLQAVGHYAMLVAAMRRAGEADQRANPKCVDAPCQQRRWQLAREAARPQAQELARLAVASEDPGAYAMALFGCRLNREDEACAQLSIARWAQLDPDNAVPWFYLAEEAAARKNEVAQNEALLRAARAKTSDYQWSTVLAMADHPTASELAPASRLAYLVHLLGIYAAFPTPPYMAVLNACTAERMADSARKQLCSDLATMMTERSKSLLELSLGTTIGERAGWPADRVQRLRDEKEAVFFVDGNYWVAEDVHSCRFLAQLETRSRELLSVGELTSARQRIAASGRSVTELAQNWRELQRQRSDAAGEKAGSR